MPNAAPPSFSIKLRILHGEVFAFGPGKAALLDAIGRLASISAAGREMGLSYSKTRRLVDEMNASFRTPLVETSRGGSERGGATVTPTGRRVLDTFRAMEAQAMEAARGGFRRLARDLAAPEPPGE
ncbi:winged helix-turn-helix domain-containing protein [Mesoterricola silvestris]|uniref:winged helix-turn-helix domain-containing protein n=1 Tax=Mesoterricola silvestris TaxID=2927979 RepID=UPI0029302773|nr:LysR family transcriptional regulator [Mesoterricola silvestris]